jgi:hypothetical protein
MQKNKYSIALIIVWAAVFWLPYLAPASQEHRDNPSTLDEYDFVARGKMSQARRTRPDQIARMDNNGEILMACLEAKTADELKSGGIRFLQSQLELLVDWDLLEYDRRNKTYQTTIHVYGSEKASKIRQHVSTTVEQLADMLDADMVSVKSHLTRIDREKSLFAILYAYVLHSYSMEQFAEEIYRKPQLSVEHPFWIGYAWAIYPLRKFNVGSTFMPEKENRFFFVSATTAPKIDFQKMSSFVNDVSVDYRVDDPELKKSLLDFSIIDEEGKLTIPVFDSDWSSKLENMAKKVYAKTVELADSKEMKEILGMDTQVQAAMFIHYELRYAFLYYLLEKGTIQAPIDFDNAANNSPSHMRNLIFLMKTEN